MNGYDKSNDELILTTPSPFTVLRVLTTMHLHRHT